MSIIKISLKALGFVALMAGTSVYASNLTVGGSTVSVDDRESAGDADAYGSDSVFNIDQMNVSWSSDDTITVDIFTNFANLNKNSGTETYNNRYGYYGKRIVNGDLLIGVDSGSAFNYAFDLGNMGWSRSAFSGTQSGGLYAINGTSSSRDRHYNSNGSAYRNGAVFGNTTGSELGSNNSWSVSHGKISFSFNVAGLSVFENASTLALSWAESCFNDDVSETFAIRRNRPVVVPEPSTALLMMLALGGLVYRQKNKVNKLSA